MQSPLPTVPPIDYPLIRAGLVCPICTHTKDRGALVCWDCYHAHNMRNGNEIADIVIALNEAALAMGITPARKHKYVVLVTADATLSTKVDVEASSPEEAERLALDEAQANPNDFDWTVDDGNSYQLYLGDPGKSATRVFAHTPDKCPSNHSNDGDDVCADCGADLQNQTPVSAE